MADTTDDAGQHRAPDQGLLERLNLSEPVRLRLWSITAAVDALLVGYGLLDDVRAALWLAVAAAFLGVGASSWVRAAVVSPVTAHRAATDAATAAVDKHLHPITAAGLALERNSVRQ